MKRRSLLKGLGALPAANLLQAQQPAVPPKPTPAAVDEIPVIESTIPDSAANTVPGFFSKDEFEALSRLCDILYPAISDIPGALAAGVPAFLDFLVGQSSATVQRNYRKGLDALNQRSQEQFRVPFAQTKTPQSESLLAPLRQPWSANADEFTAFLGDVREDVLKATQNSEEWSSIMSKRSRSSAGVGFYWFPID
ncbi:MAG TPA: gluconate 2-dehydrogenase subunit 3 family protein [Terriglobia bacterium]|nr:gluconate 2-dehydrogenase subunit 3 family protein [Terriglobia bacterium]